MDEHRQTESADFIAGKTAGRVDAMEARLDRLERTITDWLVAIDAKVERVIAQTITHGARAALGSKFAHYAFMAGIAAVTALATVYAAHH